MIRVFSVFLRLRIMVVAICGNSLVHEGSNKDSLLLGKTFDGFEGVSTNLRKSLAQFFRLNVDEIDISCVEVILEINIRRVVSSISLR